jgi:type IV pilus assembly protein PilA
MEKKKGFTLIELLAVILILGIIALIAIPIVNNIIKQSKRGAFEASMNNILGIVEDECQLQALRDEPITTLYTFSDGAVTPSLNIKGKLPKIGTITVNSDCHTSMSVTDGTFTATKTITEDAVTIEDGDKLVEVPPSYDVYNNGTIVYFNPVTGAKCLLSDYTSNSVASETRNKSGCMKWYVYNDTGDTSDVVSVILDHNTTDIVPIDTGLPSAQIMSQVNAILASDTSTWKSDLNPKLPSATEITVIIGKAGWSTNGSWFYLEGGTSTQPDTCKSGSTSNCNYGWLYDRISTNCTLFGCLNNPSGTTSGIGYWTSSTNPTGANYPWLVNNSSLNNFDFSYANTKIGLRPVITISKSVIK